MNPPSGPAAAAKKPHWSERAVLISLLGAVFVLGVSPLRDTDFWWHLRTGQLIVERGALPSTDWYLFTDSDRPWIDLHWGFQLLVAGLHALGGVDLVILVKALLVTAAVAIAWHAGGSSLPAWVRGLVWIPAVICISCRAVERPELLSQLSLAWWLWVAARAERQPRWMGLLPAIQVVWINCHALYVLGLLVGGCFAVDILLRLALRGRWGLVPVPARFSLRTMFVSGALCALAALANPWFLRGTLFPLTLYRKFSVEQDFYALHVSEFQRPLYHFANVGWSDAYLTAEISLAVLTIASFLALLALGPRISPFRVLLFAAFAHLGWEAMRNINLFALVSATILLANLADAWELWPEEDVAPEKRRGSPRSARPIAGTAPAVPLPSAFGNLALTSLFSGWIVLTVLGIVGNFAGYRGTFRLGEQPAWFGHEAMKFAGQPGFPDRAIVHQIGLAAVYEYHNGPQRKVFLDPRLEVSTQATYRAQLHIQEQIKRGDRSWETALKDADGNLPVLIFDSRFSRGEIEGLLNTPAWRLVFADSSAAVFLARPQAEALNLPAVDHTPLLHPP